MALVVSDRWKETYPDAAIGVIALSGVANPASAPALEARKAALEAELRGRYGTLERGALKALPSLQPYVAYYKRFGKTYHVQLQLESILFGGKSLPRVAALVEAMFMAELESQLLTAGHDRDRVHGPVGLDVAQGEERYVTLGGREQVLKAGDMFIHDAEGILSSILYGPDARTPIGAETRRVLFTVYAPPGIAEEAVRRHLRTLEAYVRLISPEAAVEESEVVVAAGRA